MQSNGHPHPFKTFLQALLIAAVFVILMAGPAGLLAQQVEESALMSEQPPIEGVEFRYVESNGIRMRLAIMENDGPTVLMAHGWPESWYAWRHQMLALSEAGYRVVAPDMRGFGGTEAPADVADYDIRVLAADMVGILDALGEEQAVMVGHDWGSIVAWHSVLLYPERFTGLVAMSVPYSGRGEQSPLRAWEAAFGDNFYYILYHQEPGVAEAEYDADPRGLLSRLYVSPTAAREEPEVTDRHRDAGGWIPRMGAPLEQPEWLSEEDLDYLVSQFEAAGFRGGVNYYRNFHRNWEITADLDGVTVQVPTVFLAGERDVVIAGATEDQLEASMSRVVDELRDVILLPEAGHWIQQELPDETSEILLEFVDSLYH